MPLPNDAGRINVDLRTNYNPKERDLSKMFNPDIIRMGTVWLNSFALGVDPANGPKQLYYYQQKGSFIPFPEKDDAGNLINYGGPVTDANGNIVDYTGIEVPAALFNKDNATLMKERGLSIGGTVAPDGAVDGMLDNYDYTSGGVTVKASPRINGLIGSPNTYQASLDATSARYTMAIDQSASGLTDPQYTFSYRFAKAVVSNGAAVLDASGNQTTTTVNVTVKVGNFGPAANSPPGAFNPSSFPVQMKSLSVNDVAVNVPAPNPPAVSADPGTAPTKPIKPTAPIAPKFTSTTTAADKAAATAKYNADLAKYNTDLAKYNSDLAKYNTDLAAYNKAKAQYNADVANFNTYWKNYYNLPVKLSLRSGWNVVTGDLEGTGTMRTQLIYGDRQSPDLNLTSPDKNQLRRLTTDPTNPWGPGKWDASSQTMTGISLGDAKAQVVTVPVTGQFVAVMNPDDLSFGFSLKGQVVDNSFGHKSFEVFISNLKSFLYSTKDANGNPILLPSTEAVTTTPTDPSGTSSTAAYSKIANYQSAKDGSNSTFVTQHLQTIFFGVKDTAGNSKTFALTIYLDSTAPRTGGNANPSGSVTPSASMVSLANQLYVIDLETFLLIDGTKKK